MTNSSFRIKHYSTNEQGTVWPISDHQYSVQMDGLANTHTFSKASVEDLLECGVWEKGKFTYSFKFTVPGCKPHDKQQYSMRIFPDNSTLCEWNDGEEHTMLDYSVEEIQGYLDKGEWIIVDEIDEAITELESWTDSIKYSEGDKIKIGDYTFKIHGENSEAFLNAEQAFKDRSVLEQIKSFTSGTGHDVFISEGSYKVYRKHEDMPYICHIDDQLVAVMDALIVLDEAEVE